MKTAFKSYAQNFEDLMLYRALGRVERGFYIDIGAQHPEVDSVSKAFFDRGWRGVHVEPVPHYADLLRRERPGDWVIEAAASNHVGHTTLMVFPDTGLSTTVPGVAAGHIGFGVPAPELELEVPTVTLASIADELSDSEVHWLKIDVEGLEKEVLQGWDPAKLRPWLVVVESNLPNSTQSNHSEWEELLTEADYVHVYSDGLNRFYATVERAEQLKPAFALPPNVFDDVQLGKNSFMCRELYQDFHELTDRYEAEIKTLLAQIKQSDLRHQAMLKSLSWRITLPLRSVLNFLSFAIRKKDAASLFADRQQPPLSPGTRAWLAKIDVAAEDSHT